MSSAQLFDAVQLRDIKRVREIIATGIDINQKDSRGNTLLNFAILFSSPDIVQEILKSDKLDINAFDKQGRAPIHRAALSNSIKIFDMIIKVKGVDLNMITKDERHIAPIDLVLEEKKIDMLKSLLQYKSVHINTLRQSMPPLIQAINIIRDDISIRAVEELLKRPDINLEKLDIENQTPLLHAVRKGRIPIVKMLLDKGAKINATSGQESRTALHLACENNNSKIVKELLNHGASADVKLVKDGDTPLHLACKFGYLTIVKELLKHGPPIDAKLTLDGATPLIMGCYSDNPIKIIETLLDAGANPNIGKKNGATPLYICCTKGISEGVDTLLKKGADVNAVTNFGTTPLYISCYYGHVKIVEKLLKIPEGPGAIDKNSDGFKKVIDAAKKEDEFPPSTRKLILEFFKESSPGDEPWKGWTRSDAEAMDAIFGAIEPHKNFPGNERYSFVPLDDITYCPICLAYTPRLGKAGETKGCMYMYHDCTKTAGVIYHEGLYKKYKSDDGLIWWCTICNRIAKGHQHYALGPPDVEGPLPRVLTATGSPFDKSCKPGHGGGGIEEKIRRFMRLREVAKELTGEKLTRQEAVNTLVEEMWTAGLTERRNAKRVAAALAVKEFPNKATNFPANRANAPAANRNYQNITRSAANLADLKPKISKETPKWDSIKLEALAPAVLFNHRRPDGTIVRHKRGKGDDGEDGEWLSFKTIKERIDYYVKNFGAEDFGMCPTGCGARLYPDEVKGIVSDDIHEAYRKAFNKRFAAVGGAYKRFTRRRQRKQKGGAYQGLFHELEDGKCVRPWKTGR